MVKYGTTHKFTHLNLNTQISTCLIIITADGSLELAMSTCDQEHFHLTFPRAEGELIRAVADAAGFEWDGSKTFY